MKHLRAKILSMVLVILLIMGAIPLYAKASAKEIVVLYTNDVHCGINGYEKLAAYRAQLISEGYEVLTVDLGDAIQGEVLGTLTNGSAIVDIMNTVGYDYAIPGNHEYDYGVERFLEIEKNEAEYTYLCSNWVNTSDKTPVQQPYKVVDMNGVKIGLVSVATPETYTKSTPVYFQDENGNYIYSFSEDNLVGVMQKYVDEVVSQGAEIVVMLSHLGVEESSADYRSTDIISKMIDVDVVLDGHSHTVMQGDVVKDKEGNDVIISQTGTKFEYFGEMRIDSDGDITTKLITPGEVDVTDYSSSAKEAYKAVKEKIDGYNEEIEYLYEEIGTSNTDLVINDPVTGTRIVRTLETNLGDFVADAYATVTGADIAFANGGGIRASVVAGGVTRKALMDVNPWNNDMCVIEATGKQIIDALEHGARSYPSESGGFLQASGITYDIYSWIESPVKVDDKGMFVSIDDTKDRRVNNVKVAGNPIELDKTYTVAGTLYTFMQGGDGFTMFMDSKLISDEDILCDAEMLIEYLTKHLNGEISVEKYGNPFGEGRIKVYTSKEEVSTDDSDINLDDENKDKENADELIKDNNLVNETDTDVEKTDSNNKSSKIENKSGKNPGTGDNNNIYLWIGLAVLSLGGIGTAKAYNKYKRQ